MRPIRPQLFVLHPDAAFRDRVAKGCDQGYAYAEVESWRALDERLRGASSPIMLVVDPFDDGGELSAHLRELLASYPSIPVVAAVELRPDRHEQIRRLGRWGVVQVIAIGHDDTPAAIARRLRSARGRPLRALLESVLPPETSGRARAIIDAAADVVAAGQQGEDLARALNLSRRTLSRWSERAGLPPPRRLLAWMRILLACELLDDPGRSVATVARTAGYASDSGLRRVTQKFLGSSPTELRERGAVRLAAAAFVEALTDSRLRVRVVTREG